VGANAGSGEGHRRAADARRDRGGHRLRDQQAQRGREQQRAEVRVREPQVGLQGRQSGVEATDRGAVEKEDGGHGHP
jgi:hypothetical protein